MNTRHAASMLLGSLTFGLLLAQTTPAGADGSQISITPPGSQKVITSAPERFTGSVRVQSLFDACAPARSIGGGVTF
jgi:hypothetical protein